MKKNRKTKHMMQLNPVAKHAHEFNKAQVFRDKTKYNRNAKHRKLEPLAIKFSGFIAKGSSTEIENSV